MRDTHNEYKPHDVSSVASNNNIINTDEKVNNISKEAGSRGEAASFASKNRDIVITPRISEDGGIGTIGADKSIDEKAFVEGLWDNDINKEHSIKPDVIDNPETTLKTKLGFIDDSGQLTFIPTNVMITNTKVIAGIDVKNVFRDAKKYVDKYGGNESDYRKVVGKIESAKYIFDIHFVEDKNGNEYDFKIKSKTLKEGK